MPHYFAEQINAGVIQLAGMVEAAKAKYLPASRKGSGSVPPEPNHVTTAQI